MIKIKRALISVYDKEGIVEFSEMLTKYGVEIISTGGTLKLLKENKIPAIGVSTITDFPEIMDGRVKTLHPKIHGGLLGIRSDEKHVREMEENDIPAIDMVVINLYPFEETIKTSGVTLKEAIEKIDIGGPTMLRAAAKNFKFVVTVTDTEDFQKVFEEMSLHKGSISEETSFRFAQKVFALTSRYDYAIQAYFGDQLLGMQEKFPDTLLRCFKRQNTLRYGENPHQKAALYVDCKEIDQKCYKQYHGKELSFNNLQDICSMVDIVREFDKPVACVVKHNNPCGICENADLVKAIAGAIASDPLSAFGSIVGMNRACGIAEAKAALAGLKFFEIIVAPSFSREAIDALKERKNLRIIKVYPHLFKPLKRGHLDIKVLTGGVLVQDDDTALQNKGPAIIKKLTIPTKNKLTKKDIDELLFAWRCVKVVKSNAIVITKGKQTIGIGAGQMSRIGAIDIACRQAGSKAKGAYVASDAFFPMADNITRAAKAGIKAIIQPGGSVKDADVITMADKKGIAMAFTGTRHFKH